MDDCCVINLQTVGGIPTKKIAIYLTMAPPSERPYPMTVVTILSAKVQQLIGLIQWQYMMEKREPPLQLVRLLFTASILDGNAKNIFLDLGVDRLEW